MARVAKLLIESGLVTGTSGNVSARTPDGDVLVTPSGIDYEVLEPGDVVLVDVEGEVLEGSLGPSTETPMHTGIYRARAEVGAVVHTHSIFATTLACLGWTIPPVHYMLTTLSEDGRIPLAPYTTYGTEKLAGYASEALGEEPQRVPAAEPRHHHRRGQPRGGVLQDRGAGGDGRDLLPDEVAGSPYSSPPSRSGRWRPRSPATGRRNPPRRTTEGSVGEDERLQFSGEVAWVTGSSKGIGRAVSMGLAERGCDVAVHYNSSEDAAGEVGERIEALGRDVLLLKGDVTDAGDVRRMAGEIEDHYGRLDVLVNNAGSMVARATLAEMTEDVWDRVMDVNLKSVYLCSQAVLPMMKRQGAAG